MADVGAAKIQLQDQHISDLDEIQEEYYKK
jgi:hypothetical protein